MPTFKKCPIEITTQAVDILARHESHQPLLDCHVKIDYVFAYCDRDDETGEPTGNAITHQGHKALGLTRIVNEKDRAKGNGDAEILLDGDWWSELATEEQQAALLDHELHHVALKTVKGQIVHDSIGRPKLKLRKHDVQIGWFACIAERNGKNSIEQIQAQVIMDNLGQYFWPALCPNSVPAKQISGGKKKTHEQLVARGWIRRPDGNYERAPAGTQPGAHPGEEKQHVRRGGPAKPKVARPVHPKFKVTIVVKVSDRRTRDLDAAATTILDCIVTLRRRLADSLPSFGPR
jgi:hypothetical protein